jgi:hypothetical protein
MRRVLHAAATVLALSVTSAVAQTYRESNEVPPLEMIPSREMLPADTAPNIVAEMPTWMVTCKLGYWVETMIVPKLCQAYDVALTQQAAFHWVITDDAYSACVNAVTAAWNEWPPPPVGSDLPAVMPSGQAERICDKVADKVALILMQKVEPDPTAGSRSTPKGPPFAAPVLQTPAAFVAGAGASTGG